MYSYLDIKRRENELLEKIDSIKKERIDLVSPFYELKKQYPDTFGVLLDNYEGLESEKFDTRLEILIENIETSNLENKDELITSIGNVRDRFKVINNKERMYNRFLNESVSPEKEKRENYLREVYIRTRIIEKKLEKNNTLIKEYETKRNELIEKGFESKIINAFNNVIDYDLYNANERLKNELRKLYLEAGLQEEIEAYYNDNEVELDSIAKDISKEILGESKKEKVDNVITSNSVISEEDKKTIQSEEQEKKVIPEKTEGTVNEELSVILPKKTESIVSKEKEEQETKGQDFVVEEIPEEKVPTNEVDKDNQPEKQNDLENNNETNSNDEEKEKKTASYSNPNIKVTYPFNLSTDVSMYKKKSELEGIADELVGKWVVKNNEGLYINIDDATEFEPEQAILVLPDNAIINNENGTYNIPNDSQIPNDYKANDFITPKEEEQFEILSSHKNWMLEQKIKLKKNLRVVLGIASLAATTASLATGAGLLTAIPLGVMATNLIQGIKDTPEKSVVSESKRLYKETKEFINSYGYYLPDNMREDIIKDAKIVKTMTETIKDNKKNGNLELDEITKLEYFNTKLTTELESAYKYYELESTNTKRR